MIQIPTLETERLILRGPVADDFEPLADFFADPERSPGFGGPLGRADAWRWFASSIGHWNLRGYGFWTVLQKADSEPCGIVGLWHPEGWPEAELGWVMFENAEGKGIAFEAALAARDYAFSQMGFATLTSNIVPGNDRSVALAERLGATFEREYENDHMGVTRMYRHPAPNAEAADADGGMEAYA